MSNLTSVKKTQSTTIRDIRKQVKKISAQPIYSTNAEMSNPHTGPTQTLPIPSANPATTSSQIPVIITPNRVDTDRQNQMDRKGGQPSSHGHNRTPATYPLLSNNPDTHDSQPHVKAHDQVTAGAQTHSPPSDKCPNCAPAAYRLTPSQHLSTRRVLKFTDHLIIGDSVLRYMQGRKMACRRGERVQVISVSGMTAEDLTHWLMMQPEAHHVRMVTFHVGVNDCKRREVTSRMWHDLVSKCRRVFPDAHIQASNILPAKRPNCAMGQTVSMSNANLTAVCHNRGVALIDNSDSFAPCGRPLHDLYRKHWQDLVHPSHSGLIVLARNIRKQTLNSALSSPGNIDRSSEASRLSRNIDDYLSELRAASSDTKDNKSSAVQPTDNVQTESGWWYHHNQAYPLYEEFYPVVGSHSYDPRYFPTQQRRNIQQNAAGYQFSYY